MPEPRADRSAATVQVFEPREFRPSWHPDVLPKAPDSLVERYVLSTKALRVLLGTEQVGGLTRPVSVQAVASLCARDRIDWISVSPPGSRRPVRAFSREGVERYFAEHRGGREVPWHRMSPELRRALGVDY